MQMYDVLVAVAVPDRKLPMIPIIIAILIAWNWNNYTQKQLEILVMTKLVSIEDNGNSADNQDWVNQPELCDRFSRV